MATDLELAYEKLKSKKVVFDRLFSYYDGEQPLTYTNKRLEEVFRGLDAVFIENWCMVVIDSVKERINLRRIVGPAEYQGMIDELYGASELALESDEVHEAACVTGEGYVIAWPDEAGGLPQAYVNDPRLCHIFYEGGNPREMRMGAKWWTEDDGTMRMTLYYPKELVYYATAKKADSISSATAFKETGRAENPFGRVPFFHFRLSRRVTKGDLASVIPVQNGINKLLMDMMVAAEFGAFKQRYVISNADNLGQLKNSPNEIWDLPAGDGMGQQTVAGQFDATPLDNYLKAIDSLALAVSSITRTPKHFFFQVGSNLSGEALLAMESGLNKKAQERIDRFEPVWCGVMAFLLELRGVEVSQDDLLAIFDRPETQQPRTIAETRNLAVQAGMPLASALRLEGMTEAEIERVMAERRAEGEMAQAGLGESMLNAMREFDQGGDGNLSANPRE